MNLYEKKKELLYVKYSETNIVVYGCAKKNDYRDFPFTEESNGEEPLEPNSDKIRKLVECISESIQRRKSISRIELMKPSKKVKISTSDVLVIAHSMICKEQNHYISSNIGIVPILTKIGTIINYEVYLGFCTTCGIYMMFTSDYEKMVEEGMPLCAVHMQNEGEITKEIRKKELNVNRQM